MIRSVNYHITLTVSFLFFVLQLHTVVADDLDLILQTGHTAPIQKIKFHESKEYILSVDQENYVVVWDYALRKQYTSLHAQEPILDLCFINDSVLAISNKRGLEFWDFRKTYLIKTISTNNPCRQIEFKNNLLFINTQHIQYSQDWQKDIFIDWNTQFVTKFFLSNEGNHIGLDVQSGFELWDFHSKNFIGKISSKKTIDAEILDKEKQICIIDHWGTVKTYSFADRLKKKAVITNNRRLKKYNCIDLNAEIGVIGNINDIITLFSLKNGNIKKQFKNHDIAITALQISNKGNLLAVGGESGKIKLYDLENQDILHHFEGISANVTSIHFLDDSCSVALGYANGDIKYWDLKTHNVTTATIKRTIKDKLQNNVYSIYSLNSQNALAYRYKGSGLFRKLKPKFKKLKTSKETLELHKNRTSLNIINVKETEWNTYLKKQNGVYSLSYSSKKIVIPDGVDVLSADKSLDNKFLLCGLSNGLLFLFDYQTGDKLLELYSPTPNSFFYANPEKYYYSSKSALSYVGVKHKTSLLGFEQIDLKYNRPDIVLNSLGFVDKEIISKLEEVHIKRIKDLKVDEDQNLDQLPILYSNFKEAPIKTSKQNIEFHFSFEGNGSKLKALHLLINGAPIYGKEGIDIQHKTELDKNILLSTGNNHIQAYVENENGFKSIRNEIFIQHNREYSPTLYVLSIGSGKFMEGDFNLEFAAKDAKDIANLFKYNREFKETHITLITDKDVSKSRLETEISILQKAQIDDVILVFFAGHGILDQNLNYFLSTYSINFHHPEIGGIDYNQLELQLGNLPCRNKIIMIDACHSGEVDKEDLISIQDTVVFDDSELVFRSGGNGIKYELDKNTLELSKMIFADLRQNSGVVVLSSAGGTEYALEGQDWSNGVFTFALINGLKKKLADKNKDNKITVGELQLYVSKKVTELTQGKQTPTSRVEILEKDIRIW